jgi:hypothetical protein
MEGNMENREMKDYELDKALHDLRDTYRAAPEPPLEAMWTAIDERLERRPTRWALPRRGVSWSLVGLAAAAALVIGVGVGRWTAADAPGAVMTTPPAPVLAAGVPSVPDMAAPLHRQATTYLGEAEALLRELETDSRSGFGPRATTLLATTRLLLDSPAASDARMQELLEDLELILAQVAMLRSVGTPEAREQALETIRTALTNREMVPRVRTAVVTLVNSED